MSFLQIASWNIEHLSGASRDEKRQSVYALADHIEMAGVDVIALQEVYMTDADEEARLFDHTPVIPSSATTERRNSDLDKVCYLLEEHGKGVWHYTLLPNRNEGDTSQLCAVMWNTKRMSQTGIVPLDVEHQVDGDWLWDRRPHAVMFTTPQTVWRELDKSDEDTDEATDGTEKKEWVKVKENKTLTLVPIHMKSNYGGSTKNIRKRHKEAKTLVDALTKAQPDIDPSIILIGDTNVLKYDEPAIETLVDAGFVDLNNTDSSTYWSRQYGDSPFDRAFVIEGRPEFKYSRQYVLRSADLVLHDKYLSDHYMIKISVKTYLDDADPREGLTG